MSATPITPGRRSPTGADDPTGSLTSQTTRGFTSQEQLADVGLIHFNARLYDPTIARFTSADSIVPQPADAQSFNRYAYVRNRPLSATDPSGHDDDAINIGTTMSAAIAIPVPSRSRRSPIIPTFQTTPTPPACRASLQSR